LDENTESEIAIFREVNTRAHVIEPKNAKVLALKPKSGRTVLFVKRVNHPGTTGLHNWQYGDQMFRMRLDYAIPAALQAAMDLQDYVKRYS